MYYGSETAGRCCICAGPTLRVHLPAGSTSCVKWRHGRRLESENPTPSIDEWGTSNFILIWFETTELFWRGRPNINNNTKKNNNKMSSDMTSAADPKIPAVVGSFRFVLLYPERNSCLRFRLIFGIRNWLLFCLSFCCPAVDSYRRLFNIRRM